MVFKSPHAQYLIEFTVKAVVPFITEHAEMQTNGLSDKVS